MKRSELGNATVLQEAETDVVSVAELQAQLADKLQLLRERGRPLVVTQNGRAAAVVVTPEEFDRLEQARFLAGVKAGLDDLEAGRVVSDEELGQRLDAWFGPL